MASLKPSDVEVPAASAGGGGGGGGGGGSGGGGGGGAAAEAVLLMPDVSESLSPPSSCRLNLSRSSWE